MHNENPKLIELSVLNMLFHLVGPYQVLPTIFFTHNVNEDTHMWYICHVR